MAKQIGEETKVTLDLKTIGMIVGFVITLAGMWFGLQADIAEAKTLPEPAIDRIEYDLKDELIRQTIMDTQEDVEEIKQTIDTHKQLLKDERNAFMQKYRTTQKANRQRLDEISRQKQLELNQLLKEEFPYLFIDFWDGFAYSNGLINEKLNSGDGIHLNDLGHRMLYERVRKALDFLN